MRPREIAAEMITAMKAAAGEVWQRHAESIPEKERAEWRVLCWLHVCTTFARLQVKAEAE